jgi:small subunit ribosomal protein S7
MRKGKAPKRQLSPDIKYNDLAVAKFTNCLMRQGKKSKARNILYKAFDIITEKTKKEGPEVFQEALGKVTPVVGIKARRVGGGVYQVPIELSPARKSYLCNDWLISSARKRSERTMSERLAYEIIAAAQGEGSAIKKKTDMHRMAESNRAFSHFKF